MGCSSSGLGSSSPKRKTLIRIQHDPPYQIYEGVCMTILFTKSGRKTSPMPEIRDDKRLRSLDIVKLKSWLLKEAAEEANSLGQRLSEAYFINLSYLSLTPEEFSIVSEYLFGRTLKGYEKERRIKH